MPLDIIPRYAACHQQLADKVIGLKIRVTAIYAAAPPMPGLCKDGVINVED